MWVWRILGLFLLALGGIGIILPILPTTIFWIFAALCFARSDPKIRDWIYARPGIGPQVQLFIEEGAMTRKSKRAALIGMGGAGVLIAIIFWSHWMIVSISLILIFIGAGLVLTRRTAESPRP